MLRFKWHRAFILPAVLLFYFVGLCIGNDELLKSSVVTPLLSEQHNIARPNDVDFAFSVEEAPLCSGTSNSTLCVTRDRSLLSSDSKYCPPLSKQLLAQIAVNNTVMVTIADKLVWKTFGPSWVDSVERAGIQYWIVMALDPETSSAAASLGKGHCFNAPVKRNRLGESSDKYRWGSDHWTKRTWDKVRAVRAVYSLGFHVIHSDTDSTWFKDPLPFFSRYLDAPPDVMMSTDLTMTMNPVGVTDLELHSHPHMNINTGVYFMRQSAAGLGMLDAWLKVIVDDPHIGHDQDGFNSLVRGKAFRGDEKYGDPKTMGDNSPFFGAAFNNTVNVALLPTSSFANTYTFVNARAYERLKHELFVVHWVWGGSNPISKLQNIRDVGHYVDPPEYYHPDRLLSFDLHQLKMPKNFNSIPEAQTETMIQFHIRAANYQLHQLYAAAAIAMALDRVLVLPKFQCFCSKNWYMTAACRINEPNNAEFPFDCPLSQLLRVQRVMQGVHVAGWPYGPPPPNGSAPVSSDSVGAFFDRTLRVREYSFLENERVPKDYLADRVVVGVPDKAVDAMRNMGLIAKDGSLRGALSPLIDRVTGLVSSANKTAGDKAVVEKASGAARRLLDFAADLPFGKRLFLFRGLLEAQDEGKSTEEGAAGVELRESKAKEKNGMRQAMRKLMKEDTQEKKEEEEKEEENTQEKKKEEEEKEEEKKEDTQEKKEENTQEKKKEEEEATEEEEKKQEAKKKKKDQDAKKRQEGQPSSSTSPTSTPALPPAKPLTSTAAFEVKNASHVVLTSAPLDDLRIVDALRPLASRRLLHLRWPRAMFGGFSEASLERAFDVAMRNVTSYWCCRSPKSQEKLKLPRDEQYAMVPLHMPPTDGGLTPRVKSNDR